MGKILDAIKKPAKKVAVKEVKEEVVEVAVCESCNGTGLLDADNLCVICDGSGKK